MAVYGKYSYAQRVKLLVQAMELCPACEREFLKFAEVPGRDAFELFREIMWKWFGQWSHGHGCPPEAFPAAPEAPRAPASQEAREQAETPEPSMPE